MEELAAWGVGLALSAFSIVFHYEVLQRMAARFTGLSRNPRRQVLWGVLILFGAHVIEIWIFAGGLYIGDVVLSLGDLKGDATENARTYAYLSAVTYTTVGYGEITVGGPLRIVVALEALVGLFMIAWSAAFTVFFLQRRWEEKADSSIGPPKN